MLKNILLTGTLTLLLAASHLSAATSDGLVICDADQDGQIGLADVPLAGVLVVVTNVAGTYSNAAPTSADGSFVITLPDTADSYVQYVASLPAGTIAIFPPTGFWTFQISSPGQAVSAYFLVRTPNCQPLQPGCWLDTNGKGRETKGKSAFQFTGTVTPSCPTLASSTGSWSHIDRTRKLELHGTVQQVLSSGTQDSSRFIEFSGTGSLEGIGNNRASYPVVSFIARIEDRAASGESPRYYLRVSDSTGRTLVLVTADSANPLNIAPIPVEASRLKVQFGTCENPPQ